MVCQEEMEQVQEDRVLGKAEEGAGADVLPQALAATVCAPTAE